MRTRHVEECPDIGPICALRDEPPQIHDQRLQSGELRLTAEYGFASGWSATAMLPLRAVHTTIQYEDLAGQPVQLDYENIHHRDETLVGLGDPWLVVQRGFQLEALKLGVTARVGVTVPLGSTVPDPFALALEGEAHEHIQFGTGSFDPVLSLAVRRDFHVPFNGSFGGYALAQLVPYANGYGYRAGHRLAGGLDAAGKPWRGGPVLRLGATVLHETAEAWASTAHPSEGNLGRTDVLVEAEAIWAPFKDWTFSLAVRIPVVTHAVGAQLSYPGILELGTSRLVHLHTGEEEEEERNEF